MKNIHLFCNAHIDPVWLWTWQEGAAEAISTFRCAADFCEEFEGFVFNHNEALIYKWVEEYEPELFARVKKHIENGKWKIVGGWYNQPDCNLPSGESFCRQILYGKNYFLEKFGVEPETAVNFDSFGHTRGLVQILKKSGYKNYVLSRIIEPGNYKWTGFDNSEIILHKTFEGYGTYFGKAAEKINKFVQIHKDNLPKDSLILWGVGDHGGGPSRLDIKDVENTKIKLLKEGINVIHSDPDTYFKTVDISSLPEFSESVRPFSVGCYTTMSRIKKAHRTLENNIYMAEKMMAHAHCIYGTHYDEKKFNETFDDLMFCQFHDILPGTIIEKAEVDSLNILGHGIYNAQKLQMKAFFTLCNGEHKAKENEIPVFVYNPHPYHVKTHISCEYQLANQNWNIGEFTGGKMYKNGNEIPCQFEKEASNLNLDWRKNVVFDAELEPFTMNRFDLKLETKKNHINWDISRFKKRFSFDNGEMNIVFNPETGLIDSYTVDGKKILFENSGKLLVVNDNEDSWGMEVDSFNDIAGEFKLLSPTDAARFLGYPSEEVCPFKVIEDGKVRTVLEGIYGFENSFAQIKYFVPKKGKYIKIDIILHMSEPNKMIKLSFNTVKGEFVGQTAFGTETLPMDGQAAVFHKFSAVKNDDAAFVIVNDGSYSGDYNNGVLNQALIRTAGYAAHPIPKYLPESNMISDNDNERRRIMPKDRYMKRIDVGIREFSFEFYGDNDISKADCIASVFNESPLALSFFPCGQGEKCTNFISLDNKSIIISALKKAYDGNGFVLRLYNSSDKPEKAILKIHHLNMDKEITFGKFEIKTFRMDNEKLTETDIIERKI